MRKIFLSGLGALIFSASMVSQAAEVVPEAGIRAEGKEQWDESIRIYQQELQKNPAQPHLWERIADIHARRGNPRECAAALEQAVRLSPKRPGLYAKLSQAYSSANDPKEALRSIELAVLEDPKNLTYLRARAQLAGWSKDNRVALDSYERILALAPEDEDAALGLARVSQWSGATGQAEQKYRAYLEKHPQSREAWLEYGALVSELGDSARAIELLDEYRKRFGETVPYLKQRARVLAWAGRPTETLAILDQLKATTSGDYELAYTKTIALSAVRRPTDALKSLDEVVQLRPESSEVANLKRFIKTPLRSNINFTQGYRSSSDHISITNAGLDGAYVISPETRIVAGSDAQWVRALVGSGLEKLNGEPDAVYRRDWVGVRHLLSPKVALDAQVGGGSVGNGQHLIYEMGAKFWTSDEFNMRMARKQDFYAVSPRAMSWGIERRANTLDLQWTPDLRYTVVSGLSYDTFSDGNSRHELNLAPRRAVLRNQSFNLDLGVSARWFGFNKTLDHGYYSPSLYKRYALTAFGYRKIDDDNGVSLAASWGVHQDNTMTGYRNGGDIVAEGFFGIYRDWMLDVRASLLSYGGGATAGYNARMMEFVVTKRF